MARNVDAATLMRQARELADEETASPTVAFVDRTEALAMLNASLGIWHGMLIEAVPERFETSETITATGASSYALPALHLRTLGVDYSMGGGSYFPLDRVQLQDRTRFEATGTAEGYYLRGATIVLVPAPASGSYRHSYITCATTLVNDGDTIDGVNGWEQWIVYDLAIRMLIKGKHDPAPLMIERDKLEAAIRAAAADREAATPMRIVDTRLKRY